MPQIVYVLLESDQVTPVSVNATSRVPKNLPDDAEVYNEPDARYGSIDKPVDGQYMQGAVVAKWWSPSLETMFILVAYELEV